MEHRLAKDQAMMDLEHLRPPSQEELSKTINSHPRDDKCLLYITREEMNNLILLIAEEEELPGDTIPKDGTLFVAKLYGYSNSGATLAWYEEQSDWPLRFWEEKSEECFSGNALNQFDLNQRGIKSWQRIKP
jgi:hypothetical protein